MSRPKLRPAIWLTLACAVCLLPFVYKAFHIDDPLFLWTARQIRSHPTDFYGFRVNWYFTEKPMAEVTKNPPLACYYLALAATIGGWREVPLHLAFFLPALAAILGTYLLASRLCNRPMLASLAALFTPVFLVSSTTLMCDVLMLAFWVWAMVLWEEGLARDRNSFLYAAALLIAGGAVTKYFAISLVPLLLVYTAVRKRGVGPWMIPLVIPLVLLAGYELLTHVLYGQNLLGEAASYAREVQGRSADRMPFFAKVVAGLAFTGGCLASVFFYVPLLFPRRYFLPALALVGMLMWGLYALGAIGPFKLIVDGQARTSIIVQLALTCAGGLAVLALALGVIMTGRSDHKPDAQAKEVTNAPLRSRVGLVRSLYSLPGLLDAHSLLLFMWIGGTFVFAAFVNWGINARSILPMAPAVGILVARRIDDFWGPPEAVSSRRLAWPLVPAAVLAIWVAVADYQLAGSARSAAALLAADSERFAGNLWFEGHWGFQYYMQEKGFTILDAENMHVAEGDIVAVPLNNYGIFSMPPGTARELPTLNVPASNGLATVQPLLGAGFYLHRMGPLPFAFGDVPEERYVLFQLERRVQGELSVGEARPFGE